VGFLLTIIWGGPLIRVLQALGLGKVIREETPDRHKTKMGTPTLGGLMIIIPVTLLTLILNASALLGFRLVGRTIVIPLAIMVAFGALGAVDDWIGTRGSRPGQGMRARTKFTIQSLLAIATAVALYLIPNVNDVYWPGSGQYLSMGLWYIPAAAFVIVATSNAVNLTDGLDGLAGLISATAFAVYGAICLIQGETYLALFCFTIVGSLFGFLWFNVHPAQMFMGDSGSLALGATLGVVALLSGQWLLLPIIAIVPFAETLSVILQVAYFHLTHGKRLFRMAPIHHHFELLGWSETQVVQRFWLISLLSALVGLAVAMA
jgi:phospho-N-acetylmuramoyl-pentapeptide-transferase